MNAREIGELPAQASHVKDPWGNWKIVPGMTQRQAYKIAAMQGILASSPEMWDCAEVAKMSGEAADAMLAEDSEHVGRQG